MQKLLPRPQSSRFDLRLCRQFTSPAVNFLDRFLSFIGGDVRLHFADLHSASVHAAETTKPYFTQPRTSTSFDLRPTAPGRGRPSARGQTTALLTTRMPRSLRSAVVSTAAIEASRLDGWIRPDSSSGLNRVQNEGKLSSICCERFELPSLRSVDRSRSPPVRQHRQPSRGPGVAARD